MSRKILTRNLTKGMALAALVLAASIAWGQASPPPAGDERAAPAAGWNGVVTAGAASATSAPVRVSGVTVRRGANGETLVDVSATAGAGYKVFTLDNPPRLVVDFAHAYRAAGRRSAYTADSPLVSRVRVGQFSKNPAVVRVVADLAGDPAYEVRSVRSGVRIELRSHNTVASGVRPAEIQPAAARESKPAADVNVQAALPAADTSKESAAPARLEMNSPTPGMLRAMEAARILNATTDAAVGKAPAGAAQTQDPAQQPQPQPQQGQGQAPPAPAPETQQQPQAPPTAPTPAAPAPAAPTPAPPPVVTTAEGAKYTGEPVSLNLKDLDLKDFFRLIHEISGLNIIVDPNVAGSVTMVLDSVPWDQALDIVLKNNGLGKTLEGNVLRIAKLETLTAEQDTSKKLAEAREEAQPLVTRFVPINYAKASTISAMLQKWVGGGAVSKRGQILVDDRTNTLIVSDIASQIPVILPIIARLDTRIKQVQIEARIVLTSKSFARSLGVQIASIAKNRPPTTNASAASGAGATWQTDGGLSAGIAASTIGPGGGAVIAIHNAATRYSIDAILTAAESKNQLKTISQPKIVTQNNIAGKVTQGTQIPIQTVVNFTPTVQMIPAALQLEVTPQVTEDGNVFLIINISNSAPGTTFANGNPGIDTQQATTQVLVPDGGEVVFGGVTLTKRSNTATYVPVIGSIPIIGHLFKQTTRNDNDSELLFFVSPKVLPS